MPMDRYTINQPSSKQWLHRYHGKKVLAPRVINTKMVRIYPVKGSIISLKVESSILLKGW